MESKTVPITNLGKVVGQALVNSDGTIVDTLITDKDVIKEFTAFNSISFSVRSYGMIDYEGNVTITDVKEVSII